MDRCKFCNSDALVKNGKVRGMQRYKCKECGRNQAEGDKRVRCGNDIKHLAVAMYLNNSGFRVIGRVLNIPFQLVHRWIRKAGWEVEELAGNAPKESRNIDIIEMDELYTYIQKKSGKCEYGLLWIEGEMKLLRIIYAMEARALRGS